MRHQVRILATSNRPAVRLRAAEAQLQALRARANLPPLTSETITPYRPSPEGPDDPRYTHIEEIGSYYETERYREFESRLRRESKAAGLRVAAIERVVGVWLGDFEPAVSVDLEGDPETARALALRLKSEYTQEGVMEFRSDPDGPDMVYLLEGVSDYEEVAKLMGEYGLPGGRIAGKTLEIADQGGKDAEKVVLLADAIGVSIDSRQGTVQFL